MRDFRLVGSFFLVMVLCFSLYGCSRHEVRHLASDASLVVPGQSSRQEVLALLGFPDRKEMVPDGGEIWYYAQSNKSMLRRAPYVGAWMGSEDYDVLIVTFRDGEVVSCVYRNLDPEKFKSLEIDQGGDDREE